MQSLRCPSVALCEIFSLLSTYAFFLIIRIGFSALWGIMRTYLGNFHKFLPFLNPAFLDYFPLHDTCQLILHLAVEAGDDASNDDCDFAMEPSKCEENIALSWGSFTPTEWIPGD